VAGRDVFAVEHNNLQRLLVDPLPISPLFMLAQLILCDTMLLLLDIAMILNSFLQVVPSLDSRCKLHLMLAQVILHAVLRVVANIVFDLVEITFNHNPLLFLHYQLIRLWIDLILMDHTADSL
jgi:hypothetical protein